MSYFHTLNRIPGTSLFISDQWAASDITLLKQHDIKNILNVTPVTVPRHHGIMYKQVHILDTDYEDITEKFPECFEFLDNSSGNTLIHCQAGVSRSAAILIGYLMYKTNSSYQEIFDLVKYSRPIIQPNRNFEHRLKQLERKLKY